MPVVKFLYEEKEIQVDSGTTILESARLAGVVVESPCNGTGICGKCKVKVGESFVLACETSVEEDIEVETSGSHKQKTLKILDYGESFDISLDGFIEKKFDAGKNKTSVYGGDNLLGTEEGDTSDEIYGVVVDIGTTTLVTSLADLNSGKELDSISALNPQAIHAQDVLSRIKLASEEKGLELLHSELIAEINRMLSELALKNKVNAKRIYEVVFSGNTCMLHLSANVNPYSLGRFPYKPEITGSIHLKAADYGLDISQFGLIYLPPVISAYVGADITSGILASKLHEKEGTTLLVDIGTNGEMVIEMDGGLSATSTAAGPAFEGMNITHGMRAGEGAIEYFNIEEDGVITIKTIGDKEPKGICGSGLLDIVGELVAAGIINRNGKFTDAEYAGIPEKLKEKLIKQDGKYVFELSDKIFLTQKDIRQVQLAKGAVRAGIEFLLKSKSIDASKVAKVLIAGSFGYHLRAKSLLNIGLLPKEFEGKINFIGNTSKSGGHAFLMNKTYRTHMAELVKEVDVVELANFKDFDKVFVECLSF